jgi:ubiquinone/menaquinone biosynthesis C-methylase UbiE
MGIFRRGEDKHTLAIAMTGVGLGDRLLNVGCTDPSLIGALSAKVGLSGRACAIVASGEQATLARRGAESAGALVEIETGSLEAFPFEDGAFTVAAIDNQAGLLSSIPAATRAAMFRQVHRTLAPRGRVVIIERGTPTGLGALFKSGTQEPADPTYSLAGGALGVLTAEGFRSARQLADRDGLSFFEAVR